jgi:hypothetical protein
MIQTQSIHRVLSATYHRATPIVRIDLKIGATESGFVSRQVVSSFRDIGKVVEAKSGQVVTMLSVRTGGGGGGVSCRPVSIMHTNI